MLRDPASLRDPRAPRPNVLLVVVDCLRADRVGSPERPVPFLERLGADGTLFTEAIAAASLTPPSFGSILTGRPPFAHGLRTLTSTLSPAVPLLQEALGSAGYHTVARVTGPLSAATGLYRGFDDARWRRPDEYLDTPWGRGLRAEITSLPSPWFLLLHLWELHWPRRIPLSRQRERFGRTRYDRAVSALDEQLERLVDGLPRDTLVALTGDHGEHLDTPYDRVGAFRLAATETARWSWRRVWDVAGRLAGCAERRRLLRGRLGFADVLHGADVSDDLLRVPWIVRGPGVPRGVRVEGQVRHIDIAPTLLDLVGVGALEGSESSLAGEMAKRRVIDRPAFAEAAGPPFTEKGEWVACVRMDGYKLVHRPYAPDAEPTLFDLRRDPKELSDISRADPDRTASMLAIMRAMVAAAVDVTPQVDDPRVVERLGELGYLEDR